MTRLVLHIGTEKTGTTSIQHFMSNNRQALLAHGVLYPHIGQRKDAHFDLVNSLHPLDNNGKYMEFLAPVSDTSLYLWDKLAECIKAHPDKTIVISAEHFSSRLRAKALAFMRDFFKQHDIEPEIIIYLRPQADYIESSYSTEIKAGSPKVFPKVMEQYQSQPLRYDYKKLVDLWSGFFGKKALKLIPYEKSSIGDDIRLSFLAVLGVTETSSLDFSQQKLNEKWSNPMLEFARIANARMKHIVGQERHDFMTFAQQLIESELQPQRARLMTQAQNDEVVAFYAESNRQLCAEYGLGRETLFIDIPKNVPFRESITAPYLTHVDFMQLIYAFFKCQNSI
jgi:hypothetical protein